MDDLSTCLDEIGLSGLEGCIIDELWEHVSSAEPPISLALNQDVKDYLWKQITYCSNAVKFYKLNSPKPVLQVTRAVEINNGCDGEWCEYIPPFPYTPITDDHKEIRGSCSTFYQRIDVTDEITGLPEEERGLEKINERFGHRCLVLVGSPELRAKSLFPPSCDSSMYLTQIQYALLELIGQSRRWGVLRVNVTREFFKINARSTFHIVKILTKAGLISVKIFMMNAGQGNRRTHILFLKRFMPSGHNFISNERRLCDILAAAPNNMLPVLYIRQTMPYRVYKAARYTLIKKGLVEDVNISELKDNPNLLPGSRGLRLIGDYRNLKAESDETLEDPAEEEEEEEEEEDEEEKEPCGGLIPLVAELPLEAQAYRLIDSHGAEGISNPAFLTSSFNLDKQTLRLTSKALLRSSSVVTLIMDTASVRTAKMISSWHTKQNKEIELIQSELALQEVGPNIENIVRTGSQAVRYSIKSEWANIGSLDNESKKAETNSEDEKLQSSTSIPNSQSQNKSSVVPKEKGVVIDKKPHPSEADEVGESKDVLAKYPLTLRQLRRINHINKYMKEKRVENGIASIVKYLKEVELEEGRTVTVDRKTVVKLMEYLVQTNQLKTSQRTIDLGGLSMDIKLFCVPDATDEEISLADQQAENWFKNVLYRREVKSQKTKRPITDRQPSKRSKKEKKVSDEEKEDEEEVSDGDKQPELQMDIKPVINASKFQRLKHLHYYLWILAHGFTKIEDEGEGSNGYLVDEAGEPPFSLSATHYPWANGLSKLPSCEGGRILYGDVIHNMPLSLMSLLKKVRESVISKYYKYFVDPSLSNTKLPDLPKKLRCMLAVKQSDLMCVNNIMEQLVEMKLIELDQEISRNNANLRIHLLRHAEILDTRSCAPRRTFFMEEARSMFKVIDFPLNSLADLEHYWYQLHGVCVGTPMIIRLHPQKESEISDVHPLFYEAEGMRQVTKSKEFNSKGFGAGGLAPLTFSHLNRNWVQSLPDFLTHGELVLGEFISPETEPGPSGLGTSLKRDLPHKRTQFAQSSKPNAKRKKVDTVTKSAAAVKSHTGGKGLQRIRAKQVLKGALKFKKQAKQNKDKPSISLQSLVFNRKHTPEDHLALKRMVGERSIWFPHEDNFLLLGYIASQVLFTFNHVPTDISILRNALHQQFETSGDKTSASIHRRIIFILKKKKHHQLTVTTCLEEVLQELKSMDSDARPANDFQPILHFILQRYKSHDGHVMNISQPTLLLPSTLHDLRNSYELSGIEAKSSEALASAPVVDQSSINQDLLNNLVIACLSADPNSYDAFTVYKQFENFPEHDLKLAVERLKSLFLIKQRRFSLGIPRKRGPLETQAFELAANFHQGLETHYGPNYYTELKDMQNLLDEWYNKWVEPETNEPIRIDAEDITGGKVALLISKLFDTHSVPKKLSLCEPKFPNVLLIPGEGSNKPHPQLSLEEREDEEDEDEPAAEMEITLDSQKGEDQEDDHEEEEEEEEDMGVGPDETPPMKGSTSGLPVSRYVCGMSKILQTDELSEIQAGSVDFRPSMNIGQLLDPAEDQHENPETSDANNETTPKISIEEFSTLVKKNLGYSTPDLELARKIYCLIKDAGKYGITMESVKLGVATEKTGTMTVDDIIQDLLNIQLVYSVGTATPTLVSEDHTQMWLLSDTDGSKRGVLYPWASLGEAEINVDLLDKMERKIVSLVINSPGVTLESLLSKFKCMFQKASLLKVLKGLEHSGYIRGYTLKTTPTISHPSLFSAHPSNYITGYHDNDPPSCVFFEANTRTDSLPY